MDKFMHEADIPLVQAEVSRLMGKPLLQAVPRGEKMPGPIQIKPGAMILGMIICVDPQVQPGKMYLTGDASGMEGGKDAGR
jgi:hypothetical protein